jgi:membrane-bound serine protease (ClpP class)
MLLLACATGGHASTVGLIRIKGAIGPATADYIARAVENAAQENDACLIIELDTPGGLLDSTQDIVQSLYKSKVPTVVHVTPSGANAGSAGVFITLAAEIAAMAPNTSIGAAHPVSIGAQGAEKMDDVMKAKVSNFAASYIESIAQKRGRNVAWAMAAVTNSESITSEKALELGVIDLIAGDTPDLLKQLSKKEWHGRELSVADAQVREIPLNLRERIFQLLWRPEVMLILMLAAIYGIIGELSNPGAILPGVVGAIALILALYMMSVLPVNAAGVALMILAVVLFAIDLFAPSHGILTFGGIVAFFLGALMLFDRAEPAFRLSLAYVISSTLLTAAFFVFVAGAGIRAQRLPVRVGRETLIGQTVPALRRIDSASGKVFIEGEYWNAVSETPIESGEPVEIVAVDGLTLRVQPVTKPKA